MYQRRGSCFRLTVFAIGGFIALSLYGIAERAAEASPKTAGLSYFLGESASDRMEREKALPEAQRHVNSTAASAQEKKDAETARQALDKARQALQAAEQEQNATANVAQIASRYAKDTAMDAAKAWRAAKSEEHYAETKGHKTASNSRIVNKAHAEALQLQALAEKMDTLSDRADRLSDKRTAEAEHAAAVLADARLNFQQAEAEAGQANAGAADAKKEAEQTVTGRDKILKPKQDPLQNQP